MISCDSRESIRNETLNDLKSTDWAWDINVILDKDCFHPLVYPEVSKTERQTIASYNALKIALQNTDAQWIVFMEDDLIFNKHIAHNLISWYPIKNNILNFGSLYTPKNNRCSQEEGMFWYKADCLRLYGSQFYIMSREAASWAITYWNSIEGMQDIRLTRLSRGKPIYYYTPSLVEHRNVSSVWGGVTHHSDDFNLDWKHP